MRRVIDLPMPYQPYACAALVLLMLGLLVSGKFGSDVVLMGVVTGLVVLGIIDPSDALRGFSQPALATVALLYVVSVGMKQTGAINALAARLLGRPTRPFVAQARLILPITAASAFMNNTPLVSMFLPVLGGVARRGGFSASQLYMPLSFAAIIGGVCTLIGTSTNVVVAGLVNQSGLTDAAGRPLHFGMFTISAVGVPIAVAGAAYMLASARWLLRGSARKEAGAAGGEEARQYMTAMRVAESGAIVGKTVEQAGLRHLPGLFLSRIDRRDATIIAVRPDEVIQPGDVLNFVGRLDSVVDLQQIRGLTPVADGQSGVTPRHAMRLIEAVISQASRLVGQTIRDAGFRTRYNAVVVGVHRRGHRLHGKIGDIRLQPGDTLLLEAAPEFLAAHGDSRDFYLATERSDSAAPRHERGWVALAILVAFVAVISFDLLGVLPAAMLAAGLMIVTRCCTGPQARSGIDWQVLVTIGAAYALGEGIRASGLAENIAAFIVRLVEPMGPWALLGAVYLMTTVFTQLLTNNAAAVLMFPIAMSIAQSGGYNLMPFAVVIAVAASCEFTTPIGYQTNLMVQGPGGYTWLDFLRFGGPLTLLCAAIAITLVPMVYGL